ncbi:hypothetical protein [Pontibacter harenae]|uniref:hypothetical protein n=1 Tax=Pontibacter harenae TaxID=2894083 RepID=UPI001E64DF99|nr:hypothetical protein [Pontibacter harenae]MCC9166721.1 hypothetical protein [Pontibacter harenae]
MVLGYALFGQDNDSEMFNELDVLVKPSKCDGCGYRTEYQQINNLFKIKRKSFDLSYTYDGIAIASLRFKEFCNRNNYNNILFKELEGNLGFYQIIVHDKLIPFTANLVEEFCDKCSQYRTVVDYKVDTERIIGPLQDGFYRSDLLFGGRMGKHDSPLHPIIVVAPLTKEKMRKEKLKGLTFESF